MGEAKRKQMSGYQAPVRQFEEVKARRDFSELLNIRPLRDRNANIRNEIFRDIIRGVEAATAHSLFKALNAGKCRQAVDPGGELPPTSIPLDPKWRKFETCPSFDFADLIRPQTGLSKETVKELLEDYRETIDLPFDTCVFSYQDRDLFPTNCLVVLNKSERGFTADCFLHDDLGWTRNYVNIEHTGHGIFDIIPSGKPDLDHMNKIGGTFVENIIVCCALLRLPATSLAQSEPIVLKRIGKTTSKELFPTRIVTFDRRKYVRPVHKDDIQGARRPHDRRGHIRHYKSGKRIFVRSCSIHGGSEKPPEYIIRP